MTNVNKRQKMIHLIRGRYAVPVVSTLAQLDVLTLLMGDGIAKGQDIPRVKDKNKLYALLDYLASIELLDLEAGVYRATDFGQTVFARSGSTSIIESYQNYFDNLPGLLTGDVTHDVTVDRELNIQGSGSLHNKKYFMPALDMVADYAPKTLVDLGCGDGSYLMAALKHFSEVENVLLVDLSKIAVETTAENISNAGFEAKVSGIAIDAGLVEKWSAVLPPQGKEILSAWFVIHEFSGGDIERTVDFFKSLHAFRPQASLLIGEIVKATPPELSPSCADTIMPEFLLFHALSGQAPLEWSDWLRVKDMIPYRVQQEKLYDCITVDDRVIPASFIWHLVPKD